MFPDYLFPIEAWKRYTTPVLRNATLIGYMQSGKTVLARHLATELYYRVVNAGYDDDAFRYIEVNDLKTAKSLVESVDLDRTRFFFIFVDDPLESAHSRQKNVEETALFARVRHWTIKRGLLVIIYSTQYFELLDRVMRHAMVYIWKTLPFEYFVEPEAREKMLKYIGNPDFVHVLEALTMAIYDNDPETSIVAQKKAVVRIPMKKYGPKLYDEIPLEEPPRNVWLLPERGDEEKRECESVNDEINYYINVVKKARRALAKLVGVAQARGVKFRLNRDKYLIAEWREDGRRRYTSLGNVELILGEKIPTEGKTLKELAVDA